MGGRTGTGGASLGSSFMPHWARVLLGRETDPLLDFSTWAPLPEDEGTRVCTLDAVSEGSGENFRYHLELSRTGIRRGGKRQTYYYEFGCDGNTYLINSNDVPEVAALGEQVFGRG